MSDKVENGYSKGFSDAVQLQKLESLKKVKTYPVKPKKKYIRVVYIYVGSLTPEDSEGYLEKISKDLDENDSDLYADTYVIPYRGDEPKTTIEFYEVESGQ